MKRTIQQLLLSMLLLLVGFSAEASHISAADISYRCLGNNQYEVTLRLYRNCQGVAGPGATSVRIAGTGGCAGQSLAVTLNNISRREVPLVCYSLQSQSSCNGMGTYPGHEELVYRGLADLSAFTGPNCGWIMSYNTCCRSSAITNLISPGSASLYIETELQFANPVTCNNSPIIHVPPIFDVCSNTLQNISHVATDPDGDSLAYELASPWSGRNNNIAFAGGLSSSQPLQTTGPFQFSSTTAQSTFTPPSNLSQVAVADVVISEYRNGVLINKTRRAIQITVHPCMNGNPVTLDAVDRLVSGTWVSQGSSTTFEACMGEPLTFRVHFSDADVNDTIQLAAIASSLQATYPTAAIAPTYTGSNQLTLTITIPSVQFGGFILGLVDNTCPLSRIQSYGIHIVPAANCTSLMGVGFLDANNNCVRDTNESPYPSYTLRLTKGNVLLTIPANGQGGYATQIDTGTYNVEVLINSPYYQLCAAAGTVTIPPTGGTVNWDLPIQVTAYCPYLSVNIGAPVLIHCGSSSYTVSYCNSGTADVTGAYIDVVVDSMFTVTSTTHPIDSQSGNFYRFNLDTILMGDCGFFTINGDLDTACNIALMGQTYCATAQIFPDTLCGVWSGHNLEVEGLCTGDSVSFRIRNIGTQPMPMPESYRVIEDNIILHNSPGISLNVGATTPWFSYFADGSTFRTEIPQAPGNPWNNKASATISGCISSSVGGIPITGMTNLFSLNDGMPNISIDCQPSVAAYDPNDKQGFPVGYGPDHDIEPNTDLEYRIRFQNTGTYFANDVVIRDTLSPHLDAFTAQPTVASHSYTWKLLENNILEFTFNNIMLPDSGRDMAGSQGFIDFRIKQKPNLPISTRIENSAAIYFDRNPPIFTNTTWHTIDENFIRITDLPAIVDPVAGIKVTAFPNPFKAATTIRVEGGTNYQDLRLEVYNAMGQLVHEVANQGGAQEVVLQRQSLQAKGIYFYRLVADDNLLHSGKLMAQ